MSLPVSATIERDAAHPRLATVLARLSPQRLAAKVGPAVQRLFMLHLARNPKNKKGWPSTGFWEAASDATRWEPAAGGALIRVNKVGVRQRYFGGAITPTQRRALTIPITEEAYGKTAAQIPGLFMLETKKGAYLVTSTYDKISRHEAHGRAKWLGVGAGMQANFARQRLNFYFKLVGSVTQEGNRAIIPSPEETLAAAKAAILKHLKL